MPQPLDCPEAESWQALLAGAAPPDDEERYERHLDACPACRDHLERLATFGDDFLHLARRNGDPTTVAADPTLTQVVDRLLQAKSPYQPAPDEAADLYFLAPARRPGLLGTLGDYEVEEVIGQGGMGIVLKAFEPALHRLVAIKVLSPALAGSANARRRFTREAQAAGAVCHEHIVTVHGVHEADGLPYLVMQYVAGESLQDRLDRTGRLELTDVVRIGMQAASGLAAAHARGLIHRDIKPANLLLENGLSLVRITDFGLARTADDVPLTRDGAVAGTPEYMAPEQARGEAVDHRADLFSLGSVLYACCTGRPPFRAGTPLAVLREVSDEAPAPIRSLNPDVPAWLEALIDRLLAKDPARRLQGAAEVAALVEGYLAHLRQPGTVAAPELPTATERPGPERSAASRGPGTWWWRWPVGAVLVLVALAAFELSPGPHGPTPPEPGQQPLKEFSQDFRGGQPLHPSLKLVGPDANEVARPEAQGLRITLPATRPVNNPVEVVTTFAVSGDFEITGTYELLSADRPTQGYGVGVSLNIADSDARDKFAKVARAMLVQAGSVFQSEYWTHEPQKDYQVRTKPTESRLGQLRLVRQGARLRYLAADGLGGDFQEIFAQKDFGTDEMDHIHFVVADSGSPGNAVDVRLVDLRIRAADLIPDPTGGAAPGAGPAARSGSKAWLAAAGILILVILSSLAAYLALRRRGRPGKPPAPAPGPTGEAQSEAAPAAALPAPPPTAQAAVQGRKGTRRWNGRFFLPVCLLLALGLSTPLVLRALRPATLPPGREITQDFRGGQPLPPSLTLDGGDADEVARAENGGLRITMPPTRTRTGPVGVALTANLSGDFEVTGRYEILSADPPPQGNGVGVALNLAPDGDLRQFAKVGRFLRPREGSVYVVESWDREQPGNYHCDCTPSQVHTGRLRLVREGSTLRYFVADGSSDEFRELAKREFTKEDVGLVRFVVNNSGSPAGIDARLLDLKVRSGGLVAQQPLDVSKAGLAVAEALGLGLPVLLGIAVGVVVYARRRRQTGTPAGAPAAEQKPRPEAAPAPLPFACPGCGKRLRARAVLAGKKVKCPHCGRAVLVPRPEASAVGDPAAAAPSEGLAPKGQRPPD